MIPFSQTKFPDNISEGNYPKEKSMPPPDKYKTTKTNMMDSGLTELKIDNAKTKSQNTFVSDLEDSTNNGVSLLKFNRSKLPPIFLANKKGHKQKKH